MKQPYRITDYDEKISFAFFHANTILPCIYLDEYWDYYINEYNLSTLWESFREQYKKDKFTHISFKNEFYKLYTKVSKVILPFSQQDIELKLNQSLLSINPQMPSVKIPDIQNGNYLYIDIFYNH